MKRGDIVIVDVAFVGGPGNAVRRIAVHTTTVRGVAGHYCVPIPLSRNKSQSSKLQQHRLTGWGLKFTMFCFPLLGERIASAEKSPGLGSSVGTFPSTRNASRKSVLGYEGVLKWQFQNADIPTPAQIAVAPITTKKSLGT